jgi:hypothetical protein
LYSVGLNEHTNINHKFKTFPNPVKDLFHLETENAEELDISFMDVFGKEIRKEKIANTRSINVSDLKAGIYLLSIAKDKEVIYTTKIIKEE